MELSGPSEKFPLLRSYSNIKSFVTQGKKSIRFRHDSIIGKKKQHTNLVSQMIHRLLRILKRIRNRITVGTIKTSSERVFCEISLA